MRYAFSLPLRRFKLWRQSEAYSVRSKARIFDPEASTTNCRLSNMYVIGDSLSDWLVSHAVCRDHPAPHNAAAGIVYQARAMLVMDKASRASRQGMAERPPAAARFDTIAGRSLPPMGNIDRRQFLFTGGSPLALP